MKKLLLVFLIACHGKQELTAPPPPLRPDPEPKVAVVAVKEQKDCDPTDKASELKPITFGERSIPESTKLADGARAKLKTAQSAEVDRSSKEQLVTEAVDDLITALRADPYNVGATYALAGAYARIGRKQCALNMLTRLLQMRPHPSKHADVEASLDALLGRKQVLDADFAELRKDDRFRVLISKMCEDANDPNCVYGGQKDNRER
jgi:hypothetical protein